MKKILIIILVLTSLITKGQPPHPAGSYTAHPEFNKFVGTWLWTSGTDTIKLVLQKQVIHYPYQLNYDEDRLVGWHKYVKNGVLIESDLQNVGTQWTWIGGHSVTSLFGGLLGPNKIYFTTCKDITKNKKGEMRFKMLPNSTTQAIWELRNTRGITTIPNFDYNFTMPEDLIFTKQ
jgi:hypothetical protein